MTTKNVVIFGETGAGKSSLVNLMAGEDRANTSPGMERCTMHWEKHHITFDGYDYKIFDTIGLEEPGLDMDQYLEAIENAYNLIQHLKVAGGIDLLLFCVRAGRVTATLQANYRLFYEWLCEKKVPIVLVLTGLEREGGNMEGWWDRNKGTFDKYHIRFAGHACVTAINGVRKQATLYRESTRLVRDLVKQHTHNSRDGTRIDDEVWYRRLMRGLRELLLKNLTPKKKRIIAILTQRCGMSRGAAKKLASKITSNVDGNHT